MIRLEGVRVVFGRTVALDGLTLTIGEGLTGLFGANGVGKSTLLRTVAGLIKPAAGTITIDDRRASASDESLRRRLGFAGHESGLYAHLTVAENLELFGRLHGTTPERAAVVIDALDLGGWTGTPVHALSAGLKRRAAVARALLHDPEILLLDEPYANVDDDAAQLISDAVVAWRAPGRIGIVATHGAKKVKAYADAGLILKHGRAVVHGTYRKASEAR